MKVDDLGLDCGQVLLVVAIDVAIATSLSVIVNLLLVEYMHSSLVALIVNSACAVAFAGMAIGLSFWIRHMYSDSLRQAYLDATYVSEAKTSGLLVSTVFTSLALSAFSHFVSGNVFGWSAVSNLQLLPVLVAQLAIVVALMVTYFTFFSSNALVTYARKLNEVPEQQLAATEAEEAQPLREESDDDGDDDDNTVPEPTATASRLSAPVSWFRNNDRI
ncbi:MAG: hypothetical protein CMI16_07310 [Opitutaceae bacterium]|nr:hypothetical protein [Opitutaceae bacterium]|tara:strand:+ start:165 stop:818 length:654 start_codon:yes stop_codon:yes gene_type:complete